jgi:2,5-dichloro-2,5-cyclohexadiene-1,4-diol dehydrogenase 1
MNTLDGASILVTGGGSGIGQAAALLLAQSGVRVTVADLNEQGCEHTVDQIRASGGTAQWIRTDVSLAEDVKRLVDKCVSAYGSLDGACNAAGVKPAGKVIEELSLSEWDKVLAINLTAPFLCLKYQIPALRSAGGGAIVIVASTASVKGFPRSAEYSAAKAGILGLVRSASCDHAHENIRVNALLPGATKTPMFADAIVGGGFEDYVRASHPIGRFAEPREIGTAIRWLLSPESSFVTGAAIAVDGGHTSV